MSDPTTPVPERGVPVVLAFPHQRIADMVTCAIETPVGDWLLKAVTSKPEVGAGITNKQPWYSQGLYWSHPEACLICTVDNPENDDNGERVEKRLTLSNFISALILMATKDDGAYSHHFADFLRSNEDALTADLFMQFAVYGEEVYA